jgi:isopentenyl-diphosphate delta-isomerase type 1
MNNYYNKSTLDNPKELLTQVDAKDNIIGPISREKCHNQKETPWHRTTHIYIINSKGELLLTKRSSLKDTAPNQVVISSGGHVKYGERPLETAQRELYEELGLNTDLKFIKKYKINYEYEKEFVYVYFGVDNTEPIINKKEVDEIIYVPLKNFKTDYIKGAIVFPPGSKDICDSLLKDNLLNIKNF